LKLLFSFFDSRQTNKTQDTFAYNKLKTSANLRSSLMSAAACSTGAGCATSGGGIGGGIGSVGCGGDAGGSVASGGDSGGLAGGLIGVPGAHASDPLAPGPDLKAVKNKAKKLWSKTKVKTRKTFRRKST
jgi:hypothetical protein